MKSRLEKLAVLPSGMHMWWLIRDRLSLGCNDTDAARVALLWDTFNEWTDDQIRAVRFPGDAP